MENAFKFFLNAFKAIFFSPFYILYFLIYFMIAFINHFYGEIMVILTGFHYGNKKENKYRKKLHRVLISMQNGGDAS